MTRRDWCEFILNIQVLVLMILITYQIIASNQIKNCGIVDVMLPLKDPQNL